MAVARSRTEAAVGGGPWPARPGQDLLSDAFSGNLRGLGPGDAEIGFEVLDLSRNRTVRLCTPRTGFRSTRDG